MSVNKENSNLVRLGDYITQRREKNDNLSVPIKGVTNSGFISPKQEGADTSIYNVFYKYDFIFNPARMELNSISLNLEYAQAICSSLYEIFYINNTEELLPEYLNLFIKRDEFARFCWYDAIGSARNYFRVANLQELRFPLPSIEVQRELVDTYNGLKALAEQNEALIQPLTEACQAYIVDCKKKYPEVELGGYIEECKTKNRDLKFESKDARGVYSNGTFGDTLANLEGSNLASYKVVKTSEFAYSNRINIGSIAQNNEEDVIVSPSYTVFRIKSNEILSKYLFILFRRKEFLRSTLFFAIGTIKDDFSYERMAEVKIPLPPPEVQQAIVNLYNCAEEAKKIATEAREKMKILCPALVQRAINA